MSASNASCTDLKSSTVSEDTATRTKGKKKERKTQYIFEMIISVEINKIVSLEEAINACIKATLERQAFEGGKDQLLTQ